MKKIIVIDTNVLLNNPRALFVLPDAEVVIPQTVLSELDKIKMTRADKEVRFRGREISRILFDLSEYGSLLDGVPLDNNSLIRVAQHESEGFPPTLNSKNADDRILGCAWQIRQNNPDAQVILLTNDLNMLLKAQTLGIEIQRHEETFEPTALSRFVGKIGRKKFSIGWIAVPIVLVGLFVGLWIFRVPSPISRASSAIFQTTSFPLREVQYLDLVKQDDPSHYPVWFQLGQLYMDWAQQLQSESQFSEAREKYSAAINAFKQYLAKDPISAPAKTNLGTAHFFLGNSDEALLQYIQAIDDDPNYALAHFNLAYVLYNHFRDTAGAARQFDYYLKLEPTGERANYARQKLQEINAAGQGTRGSAEKN